MADGSAQVTVQCGRCKKDKPGSDFARHVGTVNGLQRECRQCHSEQNKAHYAARKNYYVEKAASSRAGSLAEKVEFIVEVLPKCCARCGNEVSLEYHRRVPKGGMKLAEKSLKVMALHGWSVKRIRAEIEASVILCRDECEERQALP